MEEKVKEDGIGALEDRKQRFERGLDGQGIRRKHARDIWQRVPEYVTGAKVFIFNDERNRWSGDVVNGPPTRLAGLKTLQVLVSILLIFQLIFVTSLHLLYQNNCILTGYC